MGKFEDSFKRKVGRDTGKFVSNLIFGDKHSTPVRVSVRQEKMKLEKERFENERDLERQRLRNKQELEKKELEIQQEHLKQKRLNEIRSEVTQKIEALAAFELPLANDEIIRLLTKWDVQLKSHSFGNNEEGKTYINQYMDALKCKYQQGIQRLVQNGMTSSEIMPYQKTIQSYYRKKVWSIIGIPVCLFGALFLIIILLTIFD